MSGRGLLASQYWCWCEEQETKKNSVWQQEEFLITREMRNATFLWLCLHLLWLRSISWPGIIPRSATNSFYDIIINRGIRDTSLLIIMAGDGMEELHYTYWIFIDVYSSEWLLFFRPVIKSGAGSGSSLFGASREQYIIVRLQLGHRARCNWPETNKWWPEQDTSFILLIIIITSFYEMGQMHRK